MSSTHSKKSCFALVDCNNFYVSCERVFNPKLMGKPVVVLSNNDGCVISRSNEVKTLGIQMGVPYFQIDQLCRQHGIKVFSSNFTLYGDMSRRIMQILKDLCPDMEVYSIDEAFLRLDSLAEDPYRYAQKIRDTILQQTGIPVSIGIAPTKTLAKVANHIAKKEIKRGVFDLNDMTVKDIVLQNFKVEDLWGVGRKWSKRLYKLNINTAAELISKPESYTRKHFNVMMSRLVKELKGISCFSLEEMQTKKNIICSRSFGRPLKQLKDISEALSHFCAKACEKARHQKTKAQAVYVYFRTSRFNKDTVFHAANDAQTFVTPSNDTIFITSVVRRLAKKIYRPGLDYKKAGIVLLNMAPEKNFQADFFEKKRVDNKNIMSLMDRLNNRFGSRTLFLAAAGIKKRWAMKQVHRSPRYTTCWRELVRVKTN